MVCAVEGDDPGFARGEQRGAQCDLHSVLSRHAELRRPRQRISKPTRDVGLGEIAERMRDGCRGDCLHHPRVAMTQRRDAEAGREVDVLAPVLVPDAASLRSGPDQ